MEARDSVGYDARAGRSLEQWMKDAGFTDISATRIPVPFGPWPKDKVFSFISSEEPSQTILHTALSAVLVCAAAGR